MKFIHFIKMYDKGSGFRVDLDFLNKMNHRDYEYLIEDTWNSILDDFKIKNRKIDIYYNNNYIKTYTLAELYLQMIFLEAYVYYKNPIKENDLFIMPNMSTDNIHDTIEFILENFKDFFNKKKIDYEELSKIAAEMVQKIMTFSNTFSWIAPDSISLYDIIQFKKRSYKFNQLINTTIDDTMNTNEIEQKSAQLEKELVECIMEDKQNCLYPYVATGTLNKVQLRQMFTVVGTRPNLDGTVLPIAINSNFLNGLNSAAEHYAESIVARYALLTKDTYVSDSGYSSRKTDLNSLDTTIDFNVEDCGTKHLLEIEIQDDFTLKMLHNKFRVDEKGNLKAIDYHKDKFLIGQTIYIRSHILCALQKNVCKTCWGANAEILRGSRVGSFASARVNSPMTNKTISAKHYTATKSTDLSNSNLNKFFTIVQNTCFLRTDIDYTNIKLVVDKLYYEKTLENFQSNDSDSGALQLESLKLIQITKNKKDDSESKAIFDLIDTPGLFLYLSEEILENKKIVKNEPNSDNVLISLDKLDISTPILNVNVLTEGIIFYLAKFVSCIDKKSVEEFEHPKQIIDEIIGILRDLKLGCKIQHIETLVTNLVRDKRDWRKRPDFRKPEVNIQMLPIKSSIFYKNVYTTLLFEDYEAQLKKIGFFKLDSEGIFDPFFKVNKKIKRG